MKNSENSSLLVLYPLQKKFKDAGCECTVKIEKDNTTLKISYANIVTMPQSNRSAG